MVRIVILSISLVLMIIVIVVVVVVIIVVILFQHEVVRNPDSSINTVDDPGLHGTVLRYRLLHGFVVGRFLR